MVFNTGAALLDAVVLAVVSKENEGTYGYRITQDVRKSTFLNLRFIRYLEDFRRMNVWKYMTCSLTEGIEGIIN